MAHFRRKKCRRQVACIKCTQFRWMGNSKSALMQGRRKAKEYAAESAARAEAE